jgi:hypothetical protein
LRRNVENCTEGTEYHCGVKGTACTTIESTSMWFHDGMSRINSRVDGEQYELKWHYVADLPIGSSTGIISVVERTKSIPNDLVVIFPSGFNLLPTKNATRAILDYIDDNHHTYNRVILSGHSMGCSWAQFIACEMISRDISADIIAKTYVVGTGAFMFAFTDEVDVFKSHFKERYIFMASTANERERLFIDENVLEVMNPRGNEQHSRIDSGKIVSFPTIVYNLLTDEIYTPLQHHATLDNFRTQGHGRDFTFANELKVRTSRTLHAWSMYRRMTKNLRQLCGFEF